MASSAAVKPTLATRTLSTDVVVSAALALADSEGIAAVTLGRVARELGCHVTSLYTHIDSVDDLHVRMAVSVQAELAQQLWQAALGRTGVRALRELADVYRSYGETKPTRTWLLFAMTSTTDPRFHDGAQYLAEPIRATLRSFGLDDRRVRHAHRAFSAAMRGFLLAEAQGMYADDADGTFSQIVALFTGALERGDWPVEPRRARSTRGSTRRSTRAG